MMRLIVLRIFLGVIFSFTALAGPREFIFDRTKQATEWKIPIKEISADFPTDWPARSFLVLELRSSSSQRFELRIQTPEGYSRVRLHPFPHAWIRIALPVRMLSEPPDTGADMAAVGNRSRAGYFLGLTGPFRPLKNVESLALVIDRPVGKARLEIRSIRIADESPGDAVLEGEALVDEFGQAIRENWSGKAKNVEELKRQWSREDKSLAPGDFGYCRYGGYKNTQAKATGFFRVENIGGRWWFIDPDGHLFLSIGSDVMRPWIETRTAGRETVFQQLPPATLKPVRMRDGDPGASFFTWNLLRRFGDSWMTKWVNHTLRRMECWGLNTVGNWSDSTLWDAHQKAYVIPLGRWETAVNYLGLPDVYSKEFQVRADESARRQCELRKDDPWLLGYFLANEPPFPQKEQQTVQLILAGPDSATQQELKKWLAAGDTPQRRKEFIDRAFDRYVQVTSQAVRKYDPNHLNLGMRSGGRPTDAEIRVARAFDVYSVNIYDFEVKGDRVRQITELTGKPILIGEFHFGTPGRGLAASLVQVRDQAERGTAYRFYVENALAIPELIGTHWFQWVDQPCTGRFDGENYNIGLVDVTDRPYAEMIKALQATHRRLVRVHSGAEKPLARRAMVN